MAYQMIHLEAAYRLLECLSTTKYQILYPAEFILGTTIRFFRYTTLNRQRRV